MVCGIVLATGAFPAQTEVHDEYVTRRPYEFLDNLAGEHGTGFRTVEGDIRLDGPALRHTVLGEDDHIVLVEEHLVYRLTKGLVLLGPVCDVESVLEYVFQYRDVQVCNRFHIRS